MAWLAAQTNALSVDGNYHSARRLPELTTRPIERLENSKFKGIAGLGSLQQFLTTPEKYNLKYIFSNDKFYDPLMYFCGWQRLQQLENGIMVWEKLNVPPLSSILPKEDVDKWQKLLWGIIPLLTVVIAFFMNIQMIWIRILKGRLNESRAYLNFQNDYVKFNRSVLKVEYVWTILLLFIFFFGLYLFYLKNDAQRSPENAIMAYYDALDYKEFEKAHSLINPFSDLTFDQYMLEISVTDGLLSSYAKLDAIETIVVKSVEDMATVKVNADWITPLEKISKSYFRTLVKHKNKWYLEPENRDLDLPPDQLFSDNTTRYFNQGRRRITTEQTYHEDVLKQPVLEILTAKLIKFEDHYAIVGEVQNIDNVPSDVVIKGSLYNDKDEELATYNSNFYMKHKLMPKEVSSFRINFEGIAWSDIQDSIPKTFNPDEFTPVKFESPPTKFNLQLAGNVTGSGLYKNIVLSDLNINSNTVSGQLFNSGLREITVPQLLVTYYDSEKNLLWVDDMFIEEGIRQQRQQHFSYPLVKNADLEIITEDMQYCFVNGLPNKDISNKVVPERKENQMNELLQPIDHPDFSFVKIEMSNYIGNPN